MQPSPASNRSLGDLIWETKEARGTLENTYEMFPVGTPVEVITQWQDFNYFHGERGLVIRNEGRYLSIIVKFFQPRHFQNGRTQTEFGFEPQDLVRLSAITEEMTGFTPWEEALVRAWIANA